MVNVAPAYAAPLQVAPVQYATQAHTAPPLAQPDAPRVPAMSPAATATLRAATTTSISWERLESPAPATGVLARVKPIHMGVLMLLVVVVMVVMSGPTAMRTPTPGVVAGGGTSGTVVAGSGVYVPARASDAALNVAATENAPAATAKVASTKVAPAAITPAAATGPAMISVGTAQVPANIRHGGMPSPAAAANLSIRGGGRVSAADTGVVQLGGIPSPAAAEKLGPQVLPYTPSDGVTLPRATGERDSHAVDTHYNDATLPMEAPIERPVMTPGESAMRAEHMVAQDDLVGAGYTPSAGTGNQAF